MDLLKQMPLISLKKTYSTLGRYCRSCCFAVCLRYLRDIAHSFLALPLCVNGRSRVSRGN